MGVHVKAIWSLLVPQQAKSEVLWGNSGIMVLDVGFSATAFNAMHRVTRQQTQAVGVVKQCHQVCRMFLGYG
jgi:hypothetical protein